MPYLIETYKKHKGKTGLTLVNVDSATHFETIPEAEKAIFILNQEQKTDNQVLREMYFEKLLKQLTDEDTEDRILIEPTPYGYIYKTTWYTEMELVRLA